MNSENMLESGQRKRNGLGEQDRESAKGSRQELKLILHGQNHAVILYNGKNCFVASKGAAVDIMSALQLLLLF